MLTPPYPRRLRCPECHGHGVVHCTSWGGLRQGHNVDEQYDVRCGLCGRYDYHERVGLTLAESHVVELLAAPDPAAVNAIWERLGEELEFLPYTADPDPLDQTARRFTAVPKYAVIEQEGYR